jgi:archaellum component FlaC
MAQDKLEELKSILLGDELKRFDTKFMEFGDKLQKLSEGGNDPEKVKQELESRITSIEDKLGKLQGDVKMGFEKIIDTINSQFKKMDGDISEQKKEVEAMKKKFDAFKQLLA